LNTVLGIDPGFNGGLVLLGKREDGWYPVHRNVMPIVSIKKSKKLYDLKVLVSMFESPRPDHVFIEKSSIRPENSALSAFKIGYGFGILDAIAAALHISRTIVRPQTWQNEIFKDMPRDDTKKMAYMACSQLWPDVSWLATTRCRKFHDGLTDACCIAEYGRRVLNL